MAYVLRATDAVIRSRNLQPGEIGVASDTGLIYLGTGDTVAEQAFFDPAASGGSPTLVGLIDVNITPGSAIDGYVIAWNNAAGQFQAVAGGGGAASVDDLTDVDTSTDPPNVGEALVWDGSAWTPGIVAGANPALDDLTDVDTAGINVGQVIAWDGSGWTPADNIGANAMDDLTDVTLTAPAVSHFIVHNGSLFVNRVLVAADVSDYNTAWDARLAGKTTSNLIEGANLYYTTSRFDSRLATKTTSDVAEGANLYYTNARADARIAAASINALVDVNASPGAPEDGYILVWNNATSNWIVSPPGAGSVSEFDDLADAAVAGPASGHVLVHNGTLFANRALASTDISDFNTAWDARLAAANSDAVSEGVTNLYYTNARADARIAAASVDALSDVDLTGASTDDVLIRGGSGTWGPVSFILQSLIDVDVTGLADGYGLVYNGTSGNWEVSESLSVNSTGLANGNILIWNNGAGEWVPAVPVTTISTLADVDAAGATNGQILTWNNGAGEWVPITNPTFYAVDGQLSATRTLDGQNNVLYFDSVNRFAATQGGSFGLGDSWLCMDTNGSQAFKDSTAAGNKTALRVFDALAQQGVSDSAVFMANSVTKGSCPVPRMTEAQRTAIASPANWLLAAQTDGASGYYVYDGSAWAKLNASYSSTFLVANWSGQAITITAATHKQGTNPRIVQVWEDKGSTRELVMPTISINETTGDVTISVLSGQEFDGSISISA